MPKTVLAIQQGCAPLKEPLCRIKPGRDNL